MQGEEEHLQVLALLGEGRALSRAASRRQRRKWARWQGSPCLGPSSLAGFWPSCGLAPRSFCTWGAGAWLLWRKVTGCAGIQQACGVGTCARALGCVLGISPGPGRSWEGWERDLENRYRDDKEQLVSVFLAGCAQSQAAPGHPAGGGCRVPGSPRSAARHCCCVEGWETCF